MPIYDYRCSACQAAFELLVRASSLPSCPHCASTALERQVARIAPAGTSAALRGAGRRAAASAGHFSHYSKKERAKAGG